MYDEDLMDIELGLSVRNPESLTEIVVDRVVDRLLKENLPTVRERVAKERDRVIAEKVSEIVAAQVQAIFTEPYQRTTQWGAKDGEPRTFRDDISDRINAMLTQPSRDSRDRRGDKVTLLDRLIQDEVSRQLESEFKDALNEGKKQVIAALQEKGAELLGETLRKMAAKGCA